ncbi:MAG: HNH endonuclease [Pseudanabaena sp.]
MKSTNNIDEVIFEERDIQIFNIHDTKTRLSTLQNYFFPRMDILLRYTLDIIAEVYDVNPYERMTFVHCPNHRDKAKENKDFGMVHIGVGAKRGNKPLKIIKRNGQPFSFHPTYLTFKVLPSGTIHSELLLFRQGVDDAYVARISELVKKHDEVLLPMLSLTHICHRTYNRSYEFLPLHKAISPEEVGSDGIRLMSPKYHFPVDSDRGFYDLIVAFVLLYALAESFICIGEGREPNLGKMLKQFKEWYIGLDNIEEDFEEEEGEKEEEDFELTEIPNLDSYSFVRAGKWWAVLARDKWRCLSCGRSAKEDGVLLEVDHIIPRSKGGSDDMINLQTLCKKCNIGKSNKDSTRL